MAESEEFKLTSKRIDAGHALGALVPLGRFEWEQIILRCKFAQTGVKYVGLAAATWATTQTGADVRPGITRLSAVTGLTDRPVRRYLKELERFGLLYMVSSGSNFGRAGKGMASVYQLTAPEDFALTYELERNMRTWKPEDSWDMELILGQVEESLDDRADEEKHRSPVTDDQQVSPVTSDRSYANNTGHTELSPVISDTSPVISSTITGHQRPPTSALPLQESPLQKIHLQKQPSSVSQLKREPTQKNADAKNLPQKFDDEDHQAQYVEARDRLAWLPDNGASLMAEAETENPTATVMQRVILAAQKLGQQP